MFGESTNVETQPYKYNGKEFDGMYGLNLFDYGARHYDAAIGRWMNMDPLSEEYYNISPYAYVGNNLSTHNGLLKSEWRAVYRENLIRGQAGIPLRTHYGYDITTSVPRPIGPILLTPLNLSINYR
ncbi:MAG: hypothetical protein PHR13_08675 [Dysgonamonadaceae bacterium]|nr:hypothetical protein [Dysgonamonadaceae bacterium]MDD4400236.1 hypothetical protein [Dysgonamonadaceae bacterium]